MSTPIIERTNKGDRGQTIEMSLMEKRIIILYDVVNYDTAARVVQQLLWLDADDPNREIYLYINSPGGVISDGMSIYDTMQLISSPVSTVVIGQACSMGSFLAATGTARRRFLLPHSRIMLHQPSAGMSGTVSDMKINYQEAQRIKDILTDLYAKHTGQDRNVIEERLDRDTWMSAQEAVEFGLADGIIEKRVID